MELFGTGNFFRSAEMEYVSFQLQEHLAHDTIERLGELGAVQFTDLNGDLTAFKRHYTPIIRKCEEVEKKLKFFAEEMSRCGIAPEKYTPEEISIWMEHQKETLARDSRGTSLLELWDAVVSERHKDYLAIKTERDRTALALYAAVQRRHVIEKAADFFLVDRGSGGASGASRASDAWNEAAGVGRFAGSTGTMEAGAPSAYAAGGGVTDADDMSFKHVAGIIASEDKDKFTRIVFRASSGHAVTRFSDISTPLTDENGGTHAKSVFTVFYRGRTLGTKLGRICTAFSAHTHDIPNFAHEGEVASALEETRIVIADSIAWLEQERATSSATLRHLALLLRKWRTGVLREKAVAHTLNCCVRSQERGTVSAQAWVLASSVGAVRDTLTAVHTAAAEGGRMQPFFFEATKVEGAPSTPPTHIATNRITSVFQGIVNTYGFPTYGEANPAIVYIATFPFLFGVMYGDIGHGTLLTLFAAYMVWKEAEFLKKPQGEMFSMAFKGRYMLLMMGCFAIYCGFIYNDCFAVATNIFGSKWGYRVTNGTIALEATPISTDHNNVYPFGMDPAWRIVDNELLMFNSLKMKMSVIMGITHMLLGLSLKVINALHFKSKTDLYFEAIPQVVFMLALFGYMQFLIVLKWSIDWRSPSAPGPAPSLIDVMINVVLKPGTVLDPMYAGQAVVQQFLLLIVFICVPLMLFVKPVLVSRAHQAKLAAAAGSEHEQVSLLAGPLASTSAAAATSSAGSIEAGAGVELVPTGHGHAAVGAASAVAAPAAAAAHGGGGHDEHAFSEVFIHQAIETIEFVLGSVSNTASYLRLWALSLAHSQLATVFWERALVMTIEMDSTLFVVIGYAVWWALTFGVLMGMDVLECFLHALRLEWVELGNKFFKAGGYKFIPLSFASLTDAEI